MNTVYRAVIGGLTKDYPGALFPPTRRLSIENIVGSDAAAMLKDR